MHSIWQDFHFSARSLLRHRGFTFAAVLSLGLGVGASSAVFALLDALFLRPLPFRQPEQLVAVKSRSEDGRKVVGLSYPDYLDYKEREDIFSGLLAYFRFPFSISVAGRVERVAGDIVSENYFTVLGLQMPLGRGFLPEEESGGRGEPVAVISYDLWQRALGGDLSAIQRNIEINGRSFSIVGVAPQGFGDLVFGSTAVIWIPRATMGLVMPGWFRDKELLQQRDARHTTGAVGRLSPGVTLEEARVAVETHAKQLALAYPQTNQGWSVQMRPLSEDRLRPDDRAPVMSYGAILFGIALLVSFIACSNVATLQSIRALRRQTDLTVRYALGSSRTKIVRLLFTESLFLYALGLLISVPIATWVMGFLEILPLFSWAEQPFDRSAMPVHFELQLDHRVIGFASMLTFVTALLFGLGTVLVGSQRYLTTNLHGDGTRSSAGPSRSRVQSLLLMSQVALCVCLLSGASLFGRTLEKAYGVDYGFRTAKVLILSVDFNSMSARYDKVRALVFYREVLERVRSLPNVLSATWGGVVPLSGRSLVSRFVPDDRTSVDDSDWIVTESDIVSPAYMRTLGITITEGRDFVDGDDENSQGVVIINETMARQYWPDGTCQQL